MVKTKTIKKESYSSIIIKNRDYIIRRVEGGVQAGASLEEMFTVVGKELGVSFSSMRSRWYGNRKNGVPSIRSISHTLEKEKGKISARQKDRKKESALKRILQEISSVKESVNMSLKELEGVNAQNHVDILTRMKIIQDQQKTLSVIDNQPVTDSPKYLVDKNNNVKHIGQEPAPRFDEDKVNEIIRKLELLERAVDERKKENGRLAERNRDISSKLEIAEDTLSNIRLENDGLKESEKTLIEDTKTYKSIIAELTNEIDGLKGRGVMQRLLNKD